ncbi:MAG: hypothetical protein AABO58_18825 [Acidobacteriota bacterium]
MTADKPLFSRRCFQPIADGKMPDDVPDRTRRKLWRVLAEFNAPCVVRPNRYDAYEVHSDAAVEVREDLIKRYDENPAALPDEITESYIRSVTAPYLFDVLEAWSDFLGGSEQREFERAINDIFASEQCSWLIADSRIFRIDRDFVATQIIEPAFAELRAAKYRGALDELATAVSEFTSRDYKSAIQAAAKSFESVLKTILGTDTGNASQLIRELRDTLFFADLPEDIAAAMPESVFAALPFLRNRLAAHGQGTDVIDVPARYAELAVHLAAVYALFLVRTAIDLNQKAEQPAAGDEIPF